MPPNLGRAFRGRLHLPLAVPLTSNQIEVAGRLHVCLPQWKAAEEAFRQLQAAFPNHDAVSCLLKSVAINSLYATRVLAIDQMAMHVRATLSEVKTAEAGLDLVERIAEPQKARGRKRRSTSFASKYCHFFVDESKYPIYDWASWHALELHLGRRLAPSGKRPGYREFCQAFFGVKSAARLRCSTRDLDRYLWMVGMYLRWLRERRKERQVLNSDLLELFTRPTYDESDLLDTLLPSVLPRAFKGEP